MNKKMMGAVAGVALLMVPGFLVAARPRAQAMHAIVDAENNYLIGSSNGHRWLNATATGRRLRGGEVYDLFNTRGWVGRSKGSKPESAGAPCEDTSIVHLAGSQPLNAPGARPGAPIGVVAGWKVWPRPVLTQSTSQAVYRQAVAGVLKSHGLRSSGVHIDQIFRIDLDGDGSAEVLISASNYALSNGVPRPSIKAGDYSMVILRKLQHGKVITSLVEGEFYRKASSFAAPNDHKIAAILDLNGDGKMEVVVRSHYYEGSSVSVYELRDARLKEVLSTGCGA